MKAVKYTEDEYVNMIFYMYIFTNFVFFWKNYNDYEETTSISLSLKLFPDQLPQV